MLTPEGSMIINGVTIVICQVADMDRAVAFYRDTLGLSPQTQSPYWSDFAAGAVRIGLHPPFQGSEPPYAIPGKGWIVGLNTDDIRDLRERVSQAGVWVAGSYHDIPGGVVLDFADPDGNPLQAMQNGISSRDLA
jgi:predicted enzyme related to lactoylglutathione lyase